MFSKSNYPNKILMPLEAMTFAHPDLPLWMRHAFSTYSEEIQCEARQKILHSSDVVAAADRFTYDVELAYRLVIDKGFFQFQYHFGHDNYWKSVGKAFADVKFDYEQPEGSRDYIAVTNI